MRIPPKEYAWDVVIFASFGSAADCAQHLRDDLARRGFRVKIDISPERNTLRLVSAIDDDAKQAAVCVVLGTERVVAEGPTDTPTEITRYAIASTPRFPGQRPERAPNGSPGGPGTVEIGVLTEDVSSLAPRIEARLGGGRSC